MRAIFKRLSITSRLELAALAALRSGARRPSHAALPELRIPA